MIVKGSQMKIRPRRNRVSASIRDLCQESRLGVHDLVWPVFLIDGQSEEQPVDSMPGCFRMSPDRLLEKAREARDLGIHSMALFPVIEDSLKDPMAAESHNSNGLMAKSIRFLKEALPDMTLFTDVAMDPYSSDGHDGIVRDGEILNDETLEVLGKMALNQSKA